MKLETRIIVPSRYNSTGDGLDICLKNIEDFLYDVKIGQEIRLLYEGKQLYTKVAGVFDSVYDDAIYRYVEVFVINHKL